MTYKKHIRQSKENIRQCKGGLGVGVGGRGEREGGSPRLYFLMMSFDRLICFLYVMGQYQNIQTHLENHMFMFVFQFEPRVISKPTPPTSWMAEFQLPLGCVIPSYVNSFSSFGSHDLFQGASLHMQHTPTPLR